MSLADDFDKIGGPLQKPLVPKKPPPPPKAAADATAVTPTAPLSISDRLGALANWTDPFPYRARPVSPPNPHVPPTAAPNADSVEKTQRAAMPADELDRRYGDPKLQGIVGKPNTLEDDLAQATINLSKK
jgi:hypothetical protein